jgi:hypothetical protein
VSQLLGFDLTLNDLDAMLFSRPPSAKLPWVPFQQQQPRTLRDAQVDGHLDISESIDAQLSRSLRDAQAHLDEESRRVASTVGPKATIQVLLEQHAHVEPHLLTTEKKATSMMICTAHCKLRQEIEVSTFYCFY